MKTLLDQACAGTVCQVPCEALIAHLREADTLTASTVPNGLMNDAVNFDVWAVLVGIALASARAIVPIVVVRTEPLHAHAFTRAGVKFEVFIVTVI